MKRYAVLGIGLLCALGGLVCVLVINPAWMFGLRSSRGQLPSAQVSTTPIDVLFLNEEGEAQRKHYIDTVMETMREKFARENLKGRVKEKCVEKKSILFRLTINRQGEILSITDKTSAVARSCSAVLSQAIMALSPLPVPPRSIASVLEEEGFSIGFRTGHERGVR